jgi:hypothetical protein
LADFHLLAGKALLVKVIALLHMVEVLDQVDLVDQVDLAVLADWVVQVLRAVIQNQPLSNSISSNLQA